MLTLSPTNMAISCSQGLAELPHLDTVVLFRCRAILCQVGCEHPQPSAYPLDANRTLSPLVKPEHGSRHCQMPPRRQNHAPTPLRSTRLGVQGPKACSGPSKCRPAPPSRVTLNVGWPLSVSPSLGGTSPSSPEFAPGMFLSLEPWAAFPTSTRPLDLWVLPSKSHPALS